MYMYICNEILNNYDKLWYTLRTPTAAALLTVCITNRDSLTFYPTLPLRGHYALPLLLTITVGDITFGRRMGQNKTLSIIENVRKNINSVIPIHSYSPEQRNKDKNWINNCAEPERWLNDQDNHPLKLDNIERSNIKWVFFFFYYYYYFFYSIYMHDYTHSLQYLHSYWKLLTKLLQYGTTTYVTNNTNAYTVTNIATILINSTYTSKR